MPQRDLVKTGIAGLDEVLSGGIPRGNVILLEGSVGCGKTTLGVEFIYRGASQFDEPGIIVVFEVSPDKIVRDAMSFGWDLRELERKGKLRIVFTSRDVLRQELQQADSVLLEEAAKIGARRIFIDGVAHMLGGDGSSETRTAFHVFTEGLQRENLTVLAIEASAYLVEATKSLPEESIADTVIRLRMEDSERAVTRSLEIVKSRGQRRAENVLRQSHLQVQHARDYSEAILRISPVPLLVLESDLRVHTANEAFYDAFQTDPAETLGRSVFELGNNQWNIPQLRTLLEDLLPRRILVKGFEVAHDFEDIGTRIMLLNARRMESEPGFAERIILVIEDITERKQAEDALCAARDQLSDQAKHLESLVADRTARLQETVGELEHFSYTITHDMRAPLRAMRGYADLLLTQREPLSAEQTDYLRRIIKSARRMDSLIRDSLQYAKVIRERIPLSTVHPAPLLRGLIESYPNLRPPDVDIQIREPLPTVLANEAGLTQCFANLIVNAVKFVPAGKIPHIRIYAEQVGPVIGGALPTALPASAEQDLGEPDPQSASVAIQPKPGKVRFWLEDNGIGIPAQYHERIFDMFQQLDKSYEGTGIGLALVRKTASRMNGKVGVQSEPGKGSRFWLEFQAAST